MKTQAIIKSVWPYLWKYRRDMALGMGALLLTDLLKAVLPLAMRSGIDSLMKGFRLSLVFEFAALIVLLSLVKGIFQYWMRVILIGLSRDIEKPGDYISTSDFGTPTIITRTRDGRRTRYTITPGSQFRHRAQEGLLVGPLLDLLAAAEDNAGAAQEPKQA